MGEREEAERLKNELSEQEEIAQRMKQEAESCTAELVRLRFAQFSLLNSSDSMLKEAKGELESVQAERDCFQQKLKTCEAECAALAGERDAIDKLGDRELNDLASRIAHAS